MPGDEKNLCGFVLNVHGRSQGGLKTLKNLSFQVQGAYLLGGILEKYIDDILM